MIRIGYAFGFIDGVYEPPGDILLTLHVPAPPAFELQWPVASRLQYWPLMLPDWT